MKKILYGFIISTSLVSANSDIFVSTGKKDYTNSKTKIDGTTNTIGTTHTYEGSILKLQYSKDIVYRENPITHQSIETLDVKKYNLNYRYNIDKQLSFKTSYIKIIDNLAPTDQGKVYGLGSSYNIKKGLGVAFDLYKSDYEQFNVNQYDLSIYKGFKIADVKFKATLIAKSIIIDGEKYAAYTFKDKDYFTTGLKIGALYKQYKVGISAFTGTRIFTVLNDGDKVQHHAMEQNKTYSLNIGKKFENLDIALIYSYQNGKELSENQDNVDTKVTLLNFKYRF